MSRTPGGVLQVVLSLCPGGTERLVIDLSLRLREHLPVSVCCLDDAGTWAPQLTSRGVEVQALNRGPGFRPALGLEIAAMARRCGAAVLHCHQYSPFVYGALAGLRMPSLRVVFTEHGRLSDAPPTLKQKLVTRALGRRPDAVAAVSAELRQHMIAEGFDAARVRVIRNGIELGQRSAGDRAAARLALGLADDAFVVGTVARFDPVKDLSTLIAAFARVWASAPEARLVLVGDGPERERLEREVARANLSASVHFTGLRTDARALLPAFDVYANTSLSEGLSLTILEAMAASRPVVATAVGGTPEVVVPGQSGQLVAARDVDALAAALLALHASPETRRSMGAAGRELALASFSMDRMVRDYLDAYAWKGCAG